MIDYKELAKEAATSFIKEDVPLSKAIVKIAMDNDLNPTQIQRVCELANKATHRYCIMKVADKNFSFKLANSDEIMEELSGTKIEDSLTPAYEPKITLDSEKLSALFGSPQPDFDIAGATKQHELVSLGEKLASAIKEVDSRLLGELMEKDAEEQDLKFQIEQLKSFGLMPEDIRQTLCSAMPDKTEEINKIMKRIGFEPSKSGTPAKPAEEYIRVLNPAHPVVITVGNVFSKLTSITSLGNAKKYLETESAKLLEKKSDEA